MIELTLKHQNKQDFDPDFHITNKTINPEPNLVQ